MNDASMASPLSNSLSKQPPPPRRLPSSTRPPRPPEPPLRCHRLKSRHRMSFPFPLSMTAFLSNPVLENPKGLLEDEDFLHLKDTGLKVEFLQIISALKRLRDHDHDHKGTYAESESCLQTLDCLKEYVWEHLNVGHWKSVDHCWRRGYTFISIAKAIFMTALGKGWEEIMRECDFGLLMGEPILNKTLLQFAEDVSRIIREQRSVDESVMMKRDEEEFSFEEACLRPQFPESRLQIPCMDNPSLEEFSKCMDNNQPLLITGGIEHWPARQKWSVNFIRQFVGFRTVPVELGSKYTSDEWTQKLMTIEEFIEAYMSKGNHQPVSSVGYLAQHHLFEQITELKEDIKIPDYCLLGTNQQVDINAWFGPGNTVSPMHFDPKHNILVQIFGTKIIRLYSPLESERLKPYPPTSILFNTSQIDLEDVNVSHQHPDLRNVKYYEFLLKPGMMLYMPPKWWHYVKSKSPSFSVSCWFE